MQMSGSEQASARGSVSGVSLLVLLTLSMQIVLGGEGLALAEAGRDASGTRVCLRRAPTAVVRVIRDLVERCEPSVEQRRVDLAQLGGPAEPARPEGRRVRAAGVMGQWLLDLPPPFVG
ncbi:MAG: hypothetical protein ACIARR_07970 [Phycisphaerales bacterium JB059]